MEMGMKVEIITRETIKPSSPTPHHLRSFKISFVDQLAPAIYSPTVLFHTSGGDGDNKAKAPERSQRLKKSLSETLTRFYPLAGRIKDDHVSLDCTDDGAEFLEARVNCRLSDILGSPNTLLMNQYFIPADIHSPEALTGCLLLVQVTFFECGGMAIGVSISHKITDAASLGMFLKCWATLTAPPQSSELPLLLFPEYNAAATAFPPRDDFSVTLPAHLSLKACKCSTRRCLFDASSIAALQAKAASPSVAQPTRVEAVSAFIWKCAMNASRSNNMGSLRLSVLAQTVNMREMVVPLRENSFGNLAIYYSVKTEGSEIDLDLQGLVGQLRRGIQDFRHHYVKKLGGGNELICEAFKELGNLQKRDDVDCYSFTSCVRFPFYGTDFGWGRPTWVGFTNSGIKNVVLLMDTRGSDGIEAWVTLKEGDMAVFQRDQELLAFASMDSSVINMAGSGSCPSSAL